MDLKGSLINTNLKIYPTQTLIEFLTKIPKSHKVPANITCLVSGKKIDEVASEGEKNDKKGIHLNKTDLENLKKIKEIVGEPDSDLEIIEHNSDVDAKSTVDNTNNENEENKKEPLSKEGESKKPVVKSKENNKEALNENEDKETELEITEVEVKQSGPFLTTSDIDWLYFYLEESRTKGEDVPYLHILLEGAIIETPENKVIKRNPILEARCVKLRAQQEARDYRKMTKTVDNVRMRFPDDTIAYQLKQVNRQLIAVGQLLISIFAGFLFGFKGVDWMVGPLDFGVRLLLGVMCALVITLAEIYFLAKKLNEELNVPEMVQLGGPPKFLEEPSFLYKSPSKSIDNVQKEHQD